MLFFSQYIEHILQCNLFQGPLSVSLKKMEEIAETTIVATHNLFICSVIKYEFKDIK